MSKLSRAKDDLGEDYIKREIKGLKRLITYTEHFIYTEQMKKNLKDLK